MKRIGIIGIGEISKYYKMGFEKSQLLDLVAVCDIKKDPSSLNMYSKYRLYQDYLEMIDVEKLDYVLISTESSKHYSIAKECLEKGINVLIEPPCGLNINEVNELIDFAKSKALLFDVIMNAHLYDDIQYVHENHLRFGTLKEIHITCYEPICNKTKLEDERMLKSSGCYLENAFDSFNILNLFLPLKKVMLVDKKVKKDSKSKIDIRNNYILYVDGVDVYIEYDWTQDSNFRNTKFVFEKNVVTVCHSNRLTTINLKEQIDYRNEEDSKQKFYDNYLMNYDSKTNYDQISLIHKLIFKMKNL